MSRPRSGSVVLGALFGTAFFLALPLVENIEQLHEAGMLLSVLTLP